MRYSYLVFCFCVLFLIQCSSQDFTGDIRFEYNRMSNGLEFDTEIVDIKVLEVEELNITKHLNLEIEKRVNLNNLIDSQIEAVDSIIDIIKTDLAEETCWLSLKEMQYENSEVKLDSNLLKSYLKKSIRLKIRSLENDIIVKNLIQLVEKDSIIFTKNLKIKHIIISRKNDNIISDTSHYFTLNNGKFNYLNRNIFFD